MLRGHRRRRGLCLAVVILTRYRIAMTNKLLTDEELALLKHWHEQRAQECRGVDDDAAMAHDDRVLELQIMQDLFATPAR